MNANKVTLLFSGTLLAIALASGPSSQAPVQPQAGAPTPYSADHARIDAPAEEMPAQF